MVDNLSSSGITELIQEGAELRATILDLGESTIRHITRSDLTLLLVSGVYSRAVGKEIERICNQSRSSVGLDFSEVKPNPVTRKKFDGSIVALLRTARERIHGRGIELFLCAPPTELIDMLKLTGAYNDYQISPEGAPRDATLSARQAPATSPAEAAAEAASTVVHKRICQLNQSLKRAVSLEKGLDSAAKCVQRFLPASPPQLAGYSFQFHYRSSEKVGGDFFDFIPLQNGSLGLVVGDVSGHGLDAALLMGMTKKVLQLRASEPTATSPKRVLMQANTDLVGDFNKYNFVTAIYGILDPNQGTFTFSRAGHELPILFGSGAVPHAVNSRGIALGVDSGKLFGTVLDEVTIQLPPGGLLLLLTDGLAECWNARGAAFTRERLLYTLSHIDVSASCAEVLDSLLESIAEFQGGREQEDDMTAILIKRQE